MIDVSKLIAKYTLPTAVAILFAWLLLDSYKADVIEAKEEAKAALADVKHVKDTVNRELRDMTKQTARVEAMMEALLLKEGITPPPREDFQPAVDSTDSANTDST